MRTTLLKIAIVSALWFLFFGLIAHCSSNNPKNQPALRKVRIQTSAGVKDVRARVWETEHGLVIELSAPDSDDFKIEGDSDFNDVDDAMAAEESERGLVIEVEPDA